MKNQKFAIIRTVGNNKTRIPSRQLYTLGNLIERIAKGTVTHCAKYIKNELHKEQLLWKIPNRKSRREPEAHCGNQTVEQTDCGNKTDLTRIYSVPNCIVYTCGSDLIYNFVSNI